MVLGIPSAKHFQEPARQSTAPASFCVQTLRRAFVQASRHAGATKPASPHTLRHNFAKRLLRRSCDIRPVAELLEHADVGATMICTYVLAVVGGVKRPLDVLATQTSRDEPQAPDSLAKVQALPLAV